MYNQTVCAFYNIIITNCSGISSNCYIVVKQENVLFAFGRDTLASSHK